MLALLHVEIKAGLWNSIRMIAAKWFSLSTWQHSMILKQTGRAKHLHSA
jgi:hypothetical protein